MLVAAHEYVSKADALARFKQTFGDLAAAVDGVGGNPLPASLEVRLRPGPGVEQPASTASRRSCGRCPASPTSATTGSG